MAPRHLAQRRAPSSQTEEVYAFGVKGRKTGIELRDTGLRDEHGLEPIDNLFSSPEKTEPRTNGVRNGARDDSEDDSGEDMDITTTSGAGPSTLLKVQRRLSVPLPRAKSPIRTNLNSPARKNPDLERSSSPVRGSIVETHEPGMAGSVKRRLDFNAGARALSQPLAHVTSAKLNGARPAVTSGLARVRHVDDRAQDKDEEEILHGRNDDGDDDEDEDEYDDAPVANGDESMNFIGGDDEQLDGDVELGEDVEEELVEEEQEEEEEEEEQEQDEPPKAAHQKQRGRKAKPTQIATPPAEEEEDPRATEEDNAPVRQKKRGRPPKSAVENEDDDEADPPSKKRRSPRNSPDSNHLRDATEQEHTRTVNSHQPGPKAAGRKPAQRHSDEEDREDGESSQKTEKPTKAARGRPKGSHGKKRDSDVGETSVLVSRAPPLPKGRGLMIMRREEPGTVKTRSGRNSVRPLAYWRNERVDYDDDAAVEDRFGGQNRKFVLPSIKEVVRVDEQEREPVKGTKKRGRPAKAGRRRASSDQDEDEDDEAEPWESVPGTVEGDVFVWEPDFDLHPPGPDEELAVQTERLAVSAAAIETREIRGASFRFAKTLSTPFFGAGVVDLPPGSEKRAKNSRKMYMTFFVHTGRVQVTVNEASFRIGKGGMWFVPRGNYYSIENDYERPARIFFSQGCEQLPPPAEEDAAAE